MLIARKCIQFLCLFTCTLPNQQVTAQIVWGTGMIFGKMEEESAKQIIDTNISDLKRPIIRMGTLHLQKFQTQLDQHVEYSYILSRGVLKKLLAKNNFLESQISSLSYSKSVRAFNWELLNEPDVSFSRYMPDEDAALMKSMYLRLKDVEKETNIPVISPSLALPQGPWAKRVGSNGLWQYCDGLNFHYYGRLYSFPQTIDNYKSWVILMHQKGLVNSPHLPLWLTEINRAPISVFNESDSTKTFQGNYIAKAAEIAVKKGIFAFFPFAARFPKQPTFNMFDDQGQPYQSWERYLEITKKHPKRPQPTFTTSKSLPKTILSWKPDRKSHTPHKTSGCYWLNNTNEPIKGNLSITNLGKQTVMGKLIIPKTRYSKISLRAKHRGMMFHKLAYKPNYQKIKIKPKTSLLIPIEISTQSPKHFREYLSFSFNYQKKNKLALRKIKTRLFFGISKNPYNEAILDLKPEALNIKRPVRRESDFTRKKTNKHNSNLLQKSKSGKYSFYFYTDLDPYWVSSDLCEWTGINDLYIFKNNDAQYPWRAVSKAKVPLSRNYPCAITKVDGLPSDSGFVLLTTDRILGKDAWVWVYLVDEAGQQFCIWDNQGRNRFIEDNRVFLHLDDFNLMFHGNVTDKPDLVPSKIREIHLRIQTRKPNDPIKFNLQFVPTEKSNEHTFY